MRKPDYQRSYKPQSPSKYWKSCGYCSGRKRPEDMIATKYDGKPICKVCWNAYWRGVELTAVAEMLEVSA